MKKEYLTKQQVDQLLMGLAKGQEFFTEEDALVVLNWARKVAIENGLFQLVLMEKLVVKVVEGEVAFNNRNFKGVEL